MTLWHAVTPTHRCLLLAALLLALCFQLILLLRTWTSRRSRRWCAGALWAALLFVLLCALQSTARLDELPAWLLWAAAALSLLCTALVYFRSVSAERRQITPRSIQEAMDNLSVAGSFFTKYGTVKLCNRQMYRLFREMTGYDLQSLEELRSAVGRHVTDGLYRAADGRIWQYAERAVTVDGRVYTEAIFTDVSEEFAVNEELRRRNEELRRVNRKLHKMYDRAADRIREREQLAFKLKIHDEIGHCLSVLRRTLHDGADDPETERHLRELSVAAGTLVVSPRADSSDPYERLLNECAELGVELRRNGMLPVEPEIYALLVSALRECVTNCVRHAHGTVVNVWIRGIPGGYSVRITNDGERPRGELVEGGGLTDLRRSIEQAGGEMLLSHAPEFSMQLTFLREEMDL